MGETWWTHYWRDLQERPLLFPLFRLYSWIGEIERHSGFPFYIQPGAYGINNFEDKVINFLDWTLDAHEESRNPYDATHNFYDRAVFAYKNYQRYSNPTVCNVMFETKATVHQYDILNSTISQGVMFYYLAATAMHVTAFTAMTFMLRYRRLNKLSILAVSAGYTQFFMQSNTALYQLFVDKQVLERAREMGLGGLAQPCQQRKNRGLNYI